MMPDELRNAGSKPPEDLPVELDEQIDAFLAWMELEKGRSPQTVEGYESDIRQFAVFVAEAGLQDWRAVTGEHLSNWTAGLSKRGYSTGSLSRKLSAVRSLAKFLVRESYRKDDFSELVEGPRVMRRLPDTMTPADLDLLLSSPSLETAIGIRDRAIMELIYSSGLRVSELCSLRLQDVDLEAGFIRVVSGKGSKDRIVPVGDSASRAVQHYLVTARSQLVQPQKTGSIMFLSSRGSGLSRKTVWYLIKEHAARVGLDPDKVKPHLLRHSFATHLLAGGANLRAIQEMLGHADISTTQIYTRVDAGLLLDQHAQYHPRNRSS